MCGGWLVDPGGQTVGGSRHSHTGYPTTLRLSLRWRATRDAGPAVEDKMRILYVLQLYRPYINGIAVSIERQPSPCRTGHDVAIVAPALKLSDEEAWRDQSASSVSGRRSSSGSLAIAVMPERGIGASRDYNPTSSSSASLPAGCSACRSPARATYRWLNHRRDAGVVHLQPQSAEADRRGAQSSVWRLITEYYQRCDHVVASPKLP